MPWDVMRKIGPATARQEGVVGLTGRGPNSWELVFLSRGTDDVVTVEVRAEARKTYSLAATGAVAP